MVCCMYLLYIKRQSLRISGQAHSAHDHRIRRLCADTVRACCKMHQFPTRLSPVRGCLFSRLFLPELKKSKRCPHLSGIIQGTSGFEPSRPVPNHIPHYRFTANDCCRCLSKPGRRPFGQPAASCLRPKHCHELQLLLPAVCVLLFTISFYRFKKTQSRKKSCEQLIVRNFSASKVSL